MKVMLDTNILYSLFFLNSAYLRAWLKQLICDKDITICWDDYSITEFIDVVYKKNSFNKKQYIRYISLIESLSLPSSVQILYSANIAHTYKTRDIKDDRILNSAIINNVDFLITNDKDLLECQISKIKISTPSQFIVSHKKIN